MSVDGRRATGVQKLTTVYIPLTIGFPVVDAVLIVGVAVAALSH